MTTDQICCGCRQWGRGSVLNCRAAVQYVMYFGFVHDARRIAHNGQDMVKATLVVCNLKVILQGQQHTGGGI